MTKESANNALAVIRKLIKGQSLNEDDFSFWLNILDNYINPVPVSTDPLWCNKCKSHIDTPQHQLGCEGKC